VTDTTSIITLSLPEGIDCKNVTKKLEDHNIFVKAIKDLNAVRVSVSFFHTIDHIEALIHQLKQLCLKERVK
jgi:selenocysteine lyase/cysteine desulfurase